MNDPIETKELNGFIIKIYQDDNMESPESWEDNGVFLVGYHRDFTVDRGSRKDGKYTPGISQELARCIANKGNYEDGGYNDEAKDYLKQYHVFGLEAYIHSGVVLALSNEGNFCDRQWDVSQLGLVFVSKKETRMRKAALRIARGLIETWNDYLSGNVYGFTITDQEENNFDSCWGFYGACREKTQTQVMI